MEVWLKLLDKIRPRMVMLYTIDRDTPLEALQKAPVERMREIAQRVEKRGFATQVSDK